MNDITELPTLCDECGERPAVETWENDPGAQPDHLCKPCADRRRDGERFNPANSNRRRR